MKNNIDYVLTCESKGELACIVHYKSGRTRTVSRGKILIIPGKIHRFMLHSPYKVENKDNYSDYHEIIYYGYDIRTCSRT